MDWELGFPAFEHHCQMPAASSMIFEGATLLGQPALQFLSIRNVYTLFHTSVEVNRSVE
jgi:hypothetical protein